MEKTKLSEEARTLWEGVFRSANQKHSKERSERIAWKAVRDSYKEITGKTIGRSKDSTERVYHYYQFEPEQLVIQRSEDGEVYMDAVLSGVDDVFNETALKEFNTHINEHGLTGRIDEAHSEASKLMSELETVEEVEEELKKQGVMDVVKSWFKDGKLYIRSKVRKGMEKVVQQFKGVSIDVAVPKEKSIPNGNSKKYLGGKPMGFILTNNPAYEGAKILPPAM